MPDRKHLETPAQDRVRDLTRTGMTPREMAAALGVSTQRIYVILRAIRAEDERAEQQSA